MTNAIETHRETALDSPYSRDREEAIEELLDLYPTSPPETKRRILETLRQVATEATGTKEREFAREGLIEAFESAPAVGASVLVPFLCTQAADGSNSEERLDSMDLLREVYPEVDDQYQEEIGQTLSEIAGNGTYEDERRRARQRLSDVTAENQREGSTDGDREAGSVGYLGQSLAEHLATAAENSPEECLQRAEELRDFVAENPLDDGSYEEIRDEIDQLTEQLSVLPGEELDDERRARIRRIANRIERLYQR